MNDPVAMHVLKGGDNLKHEISCLFNSELFPLFDHLAECFVGTQLEHDVHILRILENTVKLDDVLVVEGLMDFDLWE